jgi:hypothetical protein
MIPFSHTWPYDIILGDMYVQYCPFCNRENVLLPLKPKELPLIRDGKKRLLVFPCCSASPTVVDNDADYLLFDRAVRIHEYKQGCCGAQRHPWRTVKAQRGVLSALSHSLRRHRSFSYPALPVRLPTV